MRRWLWILLLLLSSVAAQAQTQPWRQRIGANQIPNPGFSGTTNWYFDGNASYDATKSRTADGSGSMRFGAATSRVWQTTLFPVTPGHNYIFAAYIETEVWPPPMTDISMVFTDASGTPVLSVFGSRSGNSAAGLWEEITVAGTPSAGMAYATIIVHRLYPDPSPTDFLWLDDLYFGEGIGWGSPPTAKRPFDGVGTKVDALGNVSINKGGTFTPVFPLCIYGDGRGGVPRWQAYSNQGFNCEMWGDDTTLSWAAQATSSFNPTGMMAGVQVAQYMNQGGYGWDIGGINLTNFINNLKATGYFQSHFLWYYWDNENIFEGWNDQMRAASQMQAADMVSGQPAHPVYGLQGACNVARAYHNGFGVVHAQGQVGAYVGQANTGGAGVAGCVENLQNLEHQDEPVVVAQANIVYSGQPGGGLRHYVYKFVGLGAKAIGLWRDCYNNASDCTSIGASDVTTVPWWADVPYLRQELDQLLPLIRQPHWTTWTASIASQPTSLSIATRDYNGKGHLIVTNEAGPVTFTITVSGLGYTPTRLLNYFTGAQVTTFTGTQATVSLGANAVNSGTAVYVIDGTGTGGFPNVTSASSATGSTGAAFSYQVTATNTPSSFGASPLPAGLTIDTTSGLISGTPTTAGTTTVTLSATNAVGTGTAPLALTITQAPFPPQLLVHWKFDEGSGTSTADATGNGTTGTLVGGPSWQPGRLGPFSLLFDGATQYVTNAGLSWPVSQPVSVSLWVNTPGGTTGGAFNVGGTNERFGAHIPWSDNVLYWDYGALVGAHDARISTPFASYLGQWTHVVLVSNGTTFKGIYLNGQLAASGAIASSPQAQLEGLDVGRFVVGTLPIAWHNGLIDDFRLYTYVLSPTEIQQLYQGAVSQHRHNNMSLK